MRVLAGYSTEKSDPQREQDASWGQDDRGRVRRQGDGAGPGGKAASGP